MKKSKVAVLSTAENDNEFGGAQRFIKGLAKALTDLGCESEIINIPCPEPSYESITENYKKFEILDLSKYDMVISAKAPSYNANHPNHIVFHNHTIRVFYDIFDDQFLYPDIELLKQRRSIFLWDASALSNCKAIICQGHETARRLDKWLGIKTEIMPAPTNLECKSNIAEGEYFFLPGRLHPWKRIDLAVKAILESNENIKLIISGVGEAENELKKLANEDKRIKFVGILSEEQLIEYYSNSIAIIFLALREDYGYVTLEAFKSGKPVITCKDSGEPTSFVKHMKNGLICKPTVNSVKEAIEFLNIDKRKAVEMGKAAFDSVLEIEWDIVGKKLLKIGLEGKYCQEKTKVLVLDMQPITPTIGGGRVRLHGMYHKLGEDIEVKYIGTYDWPGEKYKNAKLTESLQEVLIPLSDEHFQMANDFRKKCNDKNIIDVLFNKMVHLSPEFVNEIEKSVAESDCIIFSHPWLYPLVKNIISPYQAVIYDAQNVESYLRSILFDIHDLEEAKVIENVIELEADLIRNSDIIFSCSQNDKEMFVRVFDVDPLKIKLTPNGVFVATSKKPSFDEKKSAKDKYGIVNKIVCTFIGSNYGPNIEAVNFIKNKLAPELPSHVFVIAGGVCNDFISENNFIILGVLDEKDKNLLLVATDIALNPIFTGSGTNIKMLEYMAWGLPIVTTAVGARGIECNTGTILISKDNQSDFINSIKSYDNYSLRDTTGIKTRTCAVSSFSWEVISAEVGLHVEQAIRYKNQPSPKFSIVIPTYERHEKLEQLISALSLQLERNFEVIIIDQSQNIWHKKSLLQSTGFPSKYFHTPVKGAVRARNTGGLFARGNVIAFIDDDCLPTEEWLLNANKYFLDNSVVGIEGVIYSDHLDSPDWRPVTNVGFEGIGFMTANLFVRRDIFEILNGFDLIFDNPHFREDTDFGWRMLDKGKVPYAADVSVFHPAQPRNLERESTAERNKFFVNDALLFKKHPDRYRDLFLKENHYRKTIGFISEFVRGFQLNNIQLPEWFIEIVEQEFSKEKNTPVLIDLLKDMPMTELYNIARVEHRIILYYLLLGRLPNEEEIQHLSSATSTLYEFICSLLGSEEYCNRVEACLNKGEIA